MCYNYTKLYFTRILFLTLSLKILILPDNFFHFHSNLDKNIEKDNLCHFSI